MKEQREGPKRSRRHDPTRPAAEVPRADWVLVALSAAGLAVSVYLTWLKWAGQGAAFCEAGSGCDIVQASRYATFIGVPTASWGAGLYLAVGVLAALGLTTQRWLIAFALTAAGVGFSLYLTALSVFVIGAACTYCLASVALVIAILGVLLWRRPAAAGRKSTVRPVRLATYASLSAVGAIVLGAFVFAAPASTPSEYQLALARHLKQIGGVMYGAYW